jgi:hypothetical protein
MRHKRVTGKLHASLLLRLAAITLDLPALVFLLQTAGLPPDVSTAPARQTALFSVCQVRIRIIDYQRREYTGGSRCQPGLSLVCLFVCCALARTNIAMPSSIFPSTSLDTVTAFSALSPPNLNHRTTHQHPQTTNIPTTGEHLSVCFEGLAHLQSAVRQTNLAVGHLRAPAASTNALGLS